MLRLLSLLAILFALTPLAAVADEAGSTSPPPTEGGAGGPRIEYEKKTVINFEDDTLEGTLKRPDGEYVDSRKKVEHSNLIHIREDWRDKVMQSSGDL